MRGKDSHYDGGSHRYVDSQSRTRRVRGEAIFFTGTDDKGCGLQVDATPFAKLRGRSIVLRGVLAFISTVIIIAIVWPEWGGSDRLPVPDTLVGVLWYSIFISLSHTSYLAQNCLQFAARVSPGVVNTWTIRTLVGAAHNHGYRNKLPSVFALVLSHATIC